MKLKIKKINSEAKIPKYTLEGDSAMELYSVEDKVIEIDEIVVCQTGIAAEIPSGFVGLIWDKSGIALNSGIKTMGGVIDSNYRGEIGVVMRNLSQNKYIINKGDKIAQMLIQKVECPIIEEAEDLNDTIRSEDGFGSTGLR